MGLIVPNAQELEVLQNRLNTALTLRLYSNNLTPIGTTLAAAFTEVTGGGYVNKPLTFANWTIVEGNPTQATYNATQEWTFTGVTGGPGTIYGYYVTRDSDSKLMWSERFPAGSLPFSPIAGSLVKILPKYAAESQF